jgi:hypothetical protein
VVSEIFPGLVFLGHRELSIVVGGADPHIVHDDREAGHQSGCAKRSPKLELVRLAVMTCCLLTWLWNNGLSCRIWTPIPGHRGHGSDLLDFESKLDLYE